MGVLTTNSFFTKLRSLVTGGGRDSNNKPVVTSGFEKRASTISLATLAPNAVLPIAGTAFTTFDIGGTADSTLVAVSGAFDATAHSTINNNFEDVATKINNIVADIAAIKAALALTADETNARVLKVEETQDNIGHLGWQGPRDYDEATDRLTLRVLASQVTVSTDNDVKLDVELYRKRGSAVLSSDLAPSFTSDSNVPVLSATEQWIVFNLHGLDFNRDDVLNIELISNGANDTNGEEILIHAIELVYNSTLVSYHAEDTSGNPLR